MQWTTTAIRYVWEAKVGQYLEQCPNKVRLDPWNEHGCQNRVQLWARFHWEILQRSLLQRSNLGEIVEIRTMPECKKPRWHHDECHHLRSWPRWSKWTRRQILRRTDGLWRHDRIYQCRLCCHSRCYCCHHLLIGNRVDKNKTRFHHSRNSRN